MPPRGGATPFGPGPGLRAQVVFGHANHGHPVFWFLALVLFVALAVLAVYALIHLLRRPASASSAQAAVAGGADAAVESVRMRYARGEIDREEFVRVATDLGAPPPAPAT